MSKPNTLKDLLVEQYITIGDVSSIATAIFDGAARVDGPEGYVVTLPDFAKLPAHVQGFITKAILESPIENIFDADGACTEDTLADKPLCYGSEDGD